MQVADKEPADAEIKTYYDAHQAEFMTEELVALEYVELNAADMKVDGTPDEATLRSRYEEQKSRFVVNEQRLASHILVKVDKNADAAAQKAAQAKAADLAARAKAGEDFAELAKANSDDVGSKAQGGDLGYLEKGMTEPAFETALFALTANGISDPVKSDEGYHIIQLREIKPSESKTFEQARGELETEFAQTERERVFAEVSGNLIDKVYENPESLAEAAKTQDLPVKRTALFGRRGGTDPVTQNPEVLKAAFSDRVLVEGQVSDPVELEPNHLIVVRADEHKASVVKPIAEVRDAIVERLRQQRATELTEALAKSLETKLKSGTTLEALAAEAKAEVQTAEGIGRDALNLEAGLVREAFKLPRPANGKPSRAVVTIRPGSHALVEVTKVVDGDPKVADKAERDRVREQLLGALAGVESRALVDVLRASMDIKVAEDRM
jgi:peptidyl-prolyl cis-trans isomerase D